MPREAPVLSRRLLIEVTVLSINHPCKTVREACERRGAALTTTSRPAPVTRTIAKVGVAGSGTMATGIIEVFAKAGYDVLFVTRGEDRVTRVRSAIEH